MAVVTSSLSSFSFSPSGPSSNSTLHHQHRSNRYVLITPRQHSNRYYCSYHGLLWKFIVLLFTCIVTTSSLASSSISSVSTTMAMAMSVRSTTAVAAGSTVSSSSSSSSMKQRLLLLEGKRILVTGGGRGIGRSIALICHNEGAHVAISSRTRDELEQTVRLAQQQQQQRDDEQQHNLSSTPQMELYVADVTNSNDVQNMIQDIVTKWGGIDIAINNAGGSQGPIKAPVDQLGNDDDENYVSTFNNLLQLNVVGPHIVTSTVVRLAMKDPTDDNSANDNSAGVNDPETCKDSGSNNGSSAIRGQILNISSKAGKVGLPNMSLYVASKFALEGLTSSWSKELYNRRIVVNSLSPGMVDTKSFPKAPGKPGVRTAESIRDSLLFAIYPSLTTTTITTTATNDDDDGGEVEVDDMMKFTGHYVHADELDRVRQIEGLPDTAAWKPIDEAPFEPKSMIVPSSTTT